MKVRFTLINRLIAYLKELRGNLHCLKTCRKDIVINFPFLDITEASLVIKKVSFQEYFINKFYCIFFIKGYKCKNEKSPNEIFQCLAEIMLSIRITSRSMLRIRRSNPLSYFRRTSTKVIPTGKTSAGYILTIRKKVQERQQLKDKQSYISTTFVRKEKKSVSLWAPWWVQWGTRWQSPWKNYNI